MMIDSMVHYDYVVIDYLSFRPFRKSGRLDLQCLVESIKKGVLPQEALRRSLYEAPLVDLELEQDRKALGGL